MKILESKPGWQRKHLFYLYHTVLEMSNVLREILTSDRWKNKRMGEANISIPIWLFQNVKLCAEFVSRNIYKQKNMFCTYDNF